MVTALWRGVDVFRPIAWLYAVYSAFVRQEDFARPWLGWVVLGVLGVWTVGMLLYRTRTTRVVGLELLLASAAILSTRLVDTSEVIVGGAKTLPGFWPAAAVVSWAVLKGWRGGMLAAAFVGAVDLPRGRRRHGEHHHQHRHPDPARWLHRLLRRSVP